MADLDLQDLAKQLLHLSTELQEAIKTSMPQIRRILITSIEQNFMVGGRFSGTGDKATGGTQRWKPSKKSQGPTLVRKGYLAKSVSAIWSDNSITLTSGMAYSAIHQFGGVIQHPGGTPYVVIGKKAVFLKKTDAKDKPGVKITKPHPITLPSRPFLVVQDEDITAIAEVVTRRLQK